MFGKKTPVSTVSTDSSTTTPNRPETNSESETEPDSAPSSVPSSTMSSTSALFHRAVDSVQHAAVSFYHFVRPKWLVPQNNNNNNAAAMADAWQLWFSQLAVVSNATSMADYLLRQFDSNNDGHISAAELLNTTESVLKQSWNNLTAHNPQEWLQAHLPPSPDYQHLYQQYHPRSIWMSMAREWPCMDWKLGLFIWRSCGGLLLVLAVLSIIPGRLHGLSAHVLRWPVLGLTYFLIFVELFVYLIIRVFIRVAEYAIARPKHRKLRRLMAAAPSYQEWYRLAKQLDQSQKREKWLADVVGWVDTGDDDDLNSPEEDFLPEDDDELVHGDPLTVATKCTSTDENASPVAATMDAASNVDSPVHPTNSSSSSSSSSPPTSSLSSGYYNWSFIRELIHDLRQARAKQDSLLALAVIQQCTRHNVGGIFSEELYSYSNTGEPKAIVMEFIDQVKLTLLWITDEAISLANNDSNRNIVTEGTGRDNEISVSQAADEIVQYEARLDRHVAHESNKIWKSFISAAMNFLDKSDQEKDKQMALSTTSSNDTSTTTAAKNPPARRPSTKVPLPSFHRERVLNFLKRARGGYGRTALCLSGGAMMGLYHFGVVKALLEADALPSIISGTSAGSVIGAILCTRTEEELKDDLEPEILQQHLICFKRPWKERLQSLWKTGCLFDFQEWMDLIMWFTRGNTTFLEAYRRTGKIFCITLSSTSKKSPPVLLNYLSAPDVTIASAVVASAAVPGFVPPVRLQVKDSNGIVRNQGGEHSQTFWDGSIQADLPTQGLAEMLNCQFFIACQCNPHIVPFFFNPKGGVGRPCRWSSGHQEDSWRGGFLLAALEMYLKNDMKAKFRFLHDVEASIGFTSTLLTQEFVGSTTIVPQVRFKQYFGLISDPSLESIKEYMQGGAVAAYEHTSMIKLHNSIARTLDECIARLESSMRQSRVRRSMTNKNRSNSNTPPRKEAGSIQSYEMNRTAGGLSPDTFDAVVVQLRRQLEQQQQPHFDDMNGTDANSTLDSDTEDDDYERLYDQN